MLRIARSLCSISAGCVIWAIGMNWILIPHNLLSGGVVGGAMLLGAALPDVEPAWLVFALNIPLLLLGWRSISREFLLYTIYGAFFFSLAADLIRLPPAPIDDPVMRALVAGVVCGIGAAVTLCSDGSAGGFEILGLHLKKKFGVQVGAVMFFMNASILIAGTFLYSIQTVLYSILFLFVHGKVLDAVLDGMARRKTIMIASRETAAIAAAVRMKGPRGAIFVTGGDRIPGGEKTVLFFVASRSGATKIKQIALSLDPAALIVVSDALEVIGTRPSPEAPLVPVANPDAGLV